jgi:hypothetical protein
MRRIITLSALALALSGGVALADRRGGGGPVVRDHGDRGPERTDNRNNNNGRFNNERPQWGGNDRGQRGNERQWRGNYRGDRGNERQWRGNDRNVVRVNRERPTFRGNRFYFSGGISRPYVRPTFNVRYRDYYRRPALVVENYDAVPGYISIQGAWNWTGYEWSWTAGHYDIDPSYDDSYNASYDDGYGTNYDVGGNASVDWSY